MASINIDTVAAEFSQWRDNKSSREQIPTRLWELVKEIAGHYPTGLISQRLNLSSSQMRKHKLITTPLKKRAPKSKETFVSTTLPAASIAKTKKDTTSNHCIELHRQDGTKLFFRGHDSTLLKIVVQQFLGE